MKGLNRFHFKDINPLSTAFIVISFSIIDFLIFPDGCMVVTSTDIWQNAEHITITGSQTVVNLVNLKPAKAYHIRMTAENKLGASEYSEVVQVTTLEEVPSGPPLNVRAEAKSSNEISVSWDAPERDHWNGILLGYYVGYQMSLSPDDKEVNPTQGFSFKTVEVRSHFGGETVLSNLNKFTQYHVIVQAYTSQGSGPPSKEIAVQTLEDGKQISIDLLNAFQRISPT